MSAAASFASVATSFASSTFSAVASFTSDAFSTTASLASDATSFASSTFSAAASFTSDAFSTTASLASDATSFASSTLSAVASFISDAFSTTASFTSDAFSTTASFTSIALSTTTSVASPTFSLTTENPSLIPALADVKVSDANSPVDSTTLDTRSCKLTESASCCSLVLISITLTLTSTTSNPVILFISVVITRLISSKISGTLFLYSTMIFKSTATCSLPTSILTPDVTLSVLINLSVKFEKKPPSTASNPETFSKA